MTTSRRILTLLLASVMLLALASCGGQSADETAAGKETAGVAGTARSGSSSKKKSKAASSSAAAETQRAELPQFVAPEADEAAQLRYDSALAALERKQGEAPRYESRYDEQIRQLYDQITGRQPFRYDSATDPLYQQYVSRYTEQDKAAMQDALTATDISLNDKGYYSEPQRR